MNLYAEGDLTYYNQPLTNCNLSRCWEDVMRQSNYEHRENDINIFNRHGGALLHVYTDGSVLLAHGGVEMGQGLHTKMIQVNAAYMDRVSLSTTGFYKTPDVAIYDWKTNTGPMFNYFTSGVAVSEVEIDTLTGDHTVSVPVWTHAIFVRKSGRSRSPHKRDRKTSVPRLHDKPRQPGAVLLLQPPSAFTAVGSTCAPWVAPPGVQDSGRHSSEDHWSSQAYPQQQGRNPRKSRSGGEEKGGMGVREKREWERWEKGKGGVGERGTKGLGEMVWEIGGGREGVGEGKGEWERGEMGVREKREWERWEKGKRGVGERVLRTDIVMDIGRSLNPAIDIGQIEGGFLQGYGLFVLEEERRSMAGALYTCGPGTYKIPGFGDIPVQLNVTLLKGASNPRAVYSSKAIGEPPLFLAASVFFAIRHAIAVARADVGLNNFFQLNSPATAEKIRMACVDQFTKPVQ
ncbi:Xanthine dehydrogenase/oxidase [Lamellibrachia satsuma]|nr:Xanthine dehydrogenase/oxidase [Lamellibrachia satsuma]